MYDWSRSLRDAGKWIWHDRPAPARHDMALFHGAWPVPAGAVTVRLHVCADNRYALYADTGAGPRLLGRGPARGDLEHTSLDPYDVDVSGRRTLRLWAAVRFLVGRPETPLAEVHGFRPGFLALAAFRGRTGALVGTAGTSRAWQAYATDAIAPQQDAQSIFWVGATEQHRADGWPADWRSRRRPRAPGWHAARELARPYPKGFPPYASDDHWLIDRALPPMDEQPRAFLRAAPVDQPAAARPAAFPRRVPPRGRLSLLLDAGEMVCAYPLLVLRGRGATATLTYAEVLKRPAPGGQAKVFELADGAVLTGPRDRFEMRRTPGPHAFETFHWRSFRFVRLDVQAGPAGAEVGGLALRATGYPWKRQQTFRADGPHAATVARIMDVSWRTLRCCTWETYMDCPFYEQLQYIGDTRLQVLVSYLASPDRRLPRQALLAFDRSRIPEGLTQSRGPATEMQLIPTFSLIYVLMLDDYVRHTGDHAFVAPLQPGADAVLRWMAARLDPTTGLLGPLPYWPFIDWVPDAWPSGVPPGRLSAPANLFYLLALDAAARFHGAGAPAREYRRAAAALRRRIRAAFWDRRRGVLHDVPVADDPDAAALSQHAQALGVLAGVIAGRDARTALRQALEGAPGLRFLQATLYFRFYLAEAMARVGWGAGLWPLLAPCREALARGSTTWPENYEPSRSECHAWGSWPMHFFGRHVLGVQPPDATGAIRIAPLQCPPLDQVSGTVVTSRGPVRVRVCWRNGRAEVQATAPKGVKLVGDRMPPVKRG